MAKHPTTNSVADPGFPRGGGANPKGGGKCQPIIWQSLPENCMKMKKFWTRGGARVPRAPLRSATEIILLLVEIIWPNCLGCWSASHTEYDLIGLFKFYFIAENVALGKQAVQPGSLLDVSTADKCVDGNKNLDLLQVSCCHPGT